MAKWANKPVFYGYFYFYLLCSYSLHRPDVSEGPKSTAPGLSEKMALSDLYLFKNLRNINLQV